MGGVRDNIAIPYAWLMRNCITLRGQWMCPRESISRFIALVRSGQLELAGSGVTTFPLENVNEAVAHAAAHPGPLQTTVLCMS